MREYNNLQILYIRNFAKMMNITSENQAVQEWVRLGLAVKYSEMFRKRFNLPEQS